jgi:hypothetical protein
MKNPQKIETIVRLPVLFSVTLYVSDVCKQNCSLVSAMVCYLDSEYAFSVRFGLYC